MSQERATAGQGRVAPDQERPTFEQLLAELEAVTDRLAGGELGIEEAVGLYERAEQLHAAATARLEEVRERVERLRTPPPG